MADTKRGVIAAGLIVEIFKYVAVFLVILLLANVIGGLFESDTGEDKLLSMYNAMTLVQTYDGSTVENIPPSDGMSSSPSQDIPEEQIRNTDPIPLESREAILAFSGGKDAYIEAPEEHYEYLQGFYVNNPEECLGDNCVCFCDQLRFTSLTSQDVDEDSFTGLDDEILGGRAYCASDLSCKSITSRTDEATEITDIPVISLYPTGGAESNCNIFGPDSTYQINELTWKNGFVIHAPFGATLYQPDADNTCPYTAQYAKSGFTYNFYERNQPTFAAIRRGANNNILQVRLNSLGEE